MQPYERFRAWQHTHRLVLTVHRITSGWPLSERYGITAQVRRAALSVPANPVEGSAKRGRMEFRRFLDISIASLAELGYLLRFARDAGYMTEAEWVAIEAEGEQAARILWGLYRKVARSQ
jgi:four helix bundle protein